MVKLFLQILFPCKTIRYAEILNAYQRMYLFIKMALQDWQTFLKGAG